MKFLAEYLGKTTLLTEYQVRTYDPRDLVTVLNDKGFRLGSGHDLVEMMWDGENRAILNCVPYMGAPNQKIELNLYNY